MMEFLKRQKVGATRQKIKFYPNSEKVGRLFEPPQPARKSRPDWFSSFPRRKDSVNYFQITEGAENNMTVKGCSPFVDGLDAGYFFTLPCDVIFERENGTLKITAMSTGGVNSPITIRPSEADWRTPWAEGVGPYDGLQLNFRSDWCFKTPRGWSALAIHPINRPELPFLMLGGVLDSDKWGESGNHPFFLHSAWQGILPKGTPMVQIIPFKRADWISETDRKGWQDYEKASYELGSVCEGWYKKNAWSRKSYR